MSIKTYTVHEFLKTPGIFFDVRSPIEFTDAHIPQAHNFPLLSDEERARVGTVYKTNSKKAAIDLGLEYIGPKLSEFNKRSKEIVASLQTPPLLKVYCARGGMRSQFMSWFLQFIGNDVAMLDGGYKAYRRHVLESFSKSSHKFIVLGGMTGIGKTEILHKLEKKNEPVIDLEHIAKHKGSAFGYDPQIEQPSPEYFENLLSLELSKFCTDESIWIEDESRLIGKCVVPKKIFEDMRNSVLVVLKTSLEERIFRISSEYANYSKEWWITSTKRIQKRLGGALTQKIISFIEMGNFQDAIQGLLGYYDSSYEYSMKRHAGKIITQDVSSASEEERISLLQEVKHCETAKI